MTDHTSIIKRLRFFIGFMLLLPICNFAFAQNNEIALQMVRDLRLGNNLSGLVTQTAMRTATFQGVIAKHGMVKSFELLQNEMKIILPKYQDEWNLNLAKSWAPHMLDSEFKSLIELNKSSPYAEKFSALQNKVGTAMQEIASPLLVKVVGEVLNEVHKKHMINQ